MSDPASQVLDPSAAFMQFHAPSAYGIPPYPSIRPQQPMGVTNPQQANDLRNFWKDQIRDVERCPSDISDFKNHQLPLARIKKIMKSDEDVRMISAEAPVVLAKGCEMFILELTLRAWHHAEENKRRTLQRNDIAAAILRTEIFDFMLDVVPKEDMKQEERVDPAPAAQAGGQMMSSWQPSPGYAMPFPPRMPMDGQAAHMTQAMAMGMAQMMNFPPQFLEMQGAMARQSVPGDAMSTQLQMAPGMPQDPGHENLDPH